MVEHALDEYGRLDVLICNAGGGAAAMFHKTPLETVRQQLEVNLMGTLAPIHAALPHMRDAGYGRILTTTSNAGLFGAVGWAAYAGLEIGHARIRLIPSQRKTPPEASVSMRFFPSLIRP